jgi:hypothetical protein
MYLAYFVHCISKPTQQHFLPNTFNMHMFYSIDPDLFVSIQAFKCSSRQQIVYKSHRSVL